MEGQRPTGSVEVPLGFRWFRFDADHGFFLNGTRLQLRGTTWHQSYPGMGNALPDSRHVKDMENIHEMGCNLFRTSHYPHDPAVIEACDRLGLLVMEEMFVGEEVENTTEYYEIQAKRRGNDRARPQESQRDHVGLSGEVDEPMKSAEVVDGHPQEVPGARSPPASSPCTPRGWSRRRAVLDVVGLYYDDFQLSDRDHRTFSRT